MTHSIVEAAVHGQRILAVLALMTGVTPAFAEDRLARNPSELTRALAAARPGDTVTLADGAWKDARIIFKAQGRPDAPITLRAQTPGRVVLTGQSRLSFSGSHLVVD